jgi:glucose-specific phosphotransferase system IIA component
MEEIYGAVVSGDVKDITECSDSVFADKVLGDGIIIIPKTKTIISPCDGQVVTIANSRHAITIKSENEVEMIIHVGIDTVEMEGEGFEGLVKSGDKIKRGQPLLNVDFKLISEKGYDTSTVFVILSMECELDKLSLDSTVSVGQDIIKCSM